jgi:hypothetical protein
VRWRKFGERYVNRILREAFGEQSVSAR